MTVRSRLAVIATTAVVAGALSVASAPADAATPPWAGYRIKAGASADAGWMGGRKLGSARVYRIDPVKRNVSTGYKPARRVPNLDGKRGASARATARAAYIVSNYGGRRDAIQAAGVDAAVYHLLKGGSWKIGKSRGSQRINQTGRNRKYVRSYAQTMLKDSAQFAGPYRKELTTTTAAVGSATKAQLKVRSASGKALSGKRVRFTYPGADPVVTYTDASGSAVAYFTVASSTPASVTSTVAGLPEWRLIVRPAKNRKASRVAIADRVATVSATSRVAVVGSQTVSVSNTASTLKVGSLLSGQYTVAGGSGTRTITRNAYGPFSTASTSCGTGTPVHTSAVSETSNGTRPLPAVKATTSGYYRWAVEAGSNETSTAATACGTAVRVQKQAWVSQSRPSGKSVQVRKGAGFDVDVKVSGFDRSEPHNVVSRLYGPFASKDGARCVESKRVAGKNQLRNVSSNGTYNMSNAAVQRSGWYVWQTTLSNGDLVLGDVSGCGVPYQVVD
ncbi:hypothetical protein ACLM5J_19670 [Nocardioides sp. Bht2]|uniref:hypothetical protein n=1 Tax=Nocardioides sp. Bht2 TaxID=3392297 RepID=UPI0039B5C2FC